METERRVLADDEDVSLVLLIADHLLTFIYNVTEVNA
jgi:hypothetical protein